MDMHINICNCLYTIKLINNGHYYSIGVGTDLVTTTPLTGRTYKWQESPAIVWPNLQTAGVTYNRDVAAYLLIYFHLNWNKRFIKIDIDI